MVIKRVRDVRMYGSTTFEKILDWLVIDRKIHPRERWTASFSVLLAVLEVFAASGWAIGNQNLVVATSMGSSAVLLFSAPHSLLFHPWPLVGGHARCFWVSGLAVGFFGAGYAVD